MASGHGSRWLGGHRLQREGHSYGLTPAADQPLRSEPARPAATEPRVVTARHTELLARYSARSRSRTALWSELALCACLERLRTSEITHARQVPVRDAWTDGPDALCVVYGPPFETRRTVGVRRVRLDAVDAGPWRLGDTTAWGHEIDADQTVDPVAFGWNVADFDVGEPLGMVSTVLRRDAEDVGWWGTLDDRLPVPPRQR